MTTPCHPPCCTHRRLILMMDMRFACAVDVVHARKGHDHPRRERERMQDAPHASIARSHPSFAHHSISALESFICSPSHRTPRLSRAVIPSIKTLGFKDSYCARSRPRIVRFLFRLCSAFIVYILVSIYVLPVRKKSNAT